MSNEVEELAKSNGWTPKEEFVANGGDPNKWRTAEDFNERGEMIGRFRKSEAKGRDLESRLNKTEAALNRLADIHAKSEERIRKEVKAELLAEKAAAVKEGDGVRVVEIDEQLDIIKEEEKQAAQGAANPKGPEVDPEIKAFSEKYPMIDEDPALAGAFRGLIGEELQKDDSRTKTEIMEAALEGLKKRVPSFFDEEEETPTSTKRVSKVSDISPKSKKSGSNSKATASMLTDEQKEFGKRFIRAGAFESLDQYAEELQKLGEI